MTNKMLNVKYFLQQLEIIERILNERDIDEKD